MSAPGLHPPKVRANAPTASTKLAPGHILMTNFYDLNYPPMVGQSGPLILDNRLQPVWFKPVTKDEVAGNLSLQTYNGKSVLAWWQGIITNTGATERGKYVIVDQHYRPVATLRGANGWLLTLHELVIRGSHAWGTANKNLPMDLGKYGGAYNGALIDSAVQEYDLKTGKLIRTWDALDHIPLGDSRATVPTNGFPWDAYHVNAIDPLSGGTFVVSMRNTWAGVGTSSAIPGTRCTRSTMRISCSMSRSSLMPASSMPIAVLTPLASSTFSAATPERSRKFDEQLWQTQVPVSASRLMSASFSQTPWPSVICGPNRPKRSICSTAVPPPRRRAYSFW